jgi:hypothetical protein
MSTWQPSEAHLSRYATLVANAIVEAKKSDDPNFLASLNPLDGATIEPIAAFGAIASRVPAGTIFMAPDLSGYNRTVFSALGISQESGKHQAWIETMPAPGYEYPITAALRVDDSGTSCYLTAIQFAASIHLFADLKPHDTLVVRGQKLNGEGYLEEVANYLNTQISVPNGLLVETAKAPQAGGLGSNLEFQTEAEIFVEESIRYNSDGIVVGTPADPQWRTIQPARNGRHLRGV